MEGIVGELKVNIVLPSRGLRVEFKGRINYLSLLMIKVNGIHCFRNLFNLIFLYLDFVLLPVLCLFCLLLCY